MNVENPQCTIWWLCCHCLCSLDEKGLVCQRDKKCYQPRQLAWLLKCGLTSCCRTGSAYVGWDNTAGPAYP